MIRKLTHLIFMITLLYSGTEQSLHLSGPFKAPNDLTNFFLQGSDKTHGTWKLHNEGHFVVSICKKKTANRESMSREDIIQLVLRGQDMEYIGIQKIVEWLESHGLLAFIDRESVWKVIMMNLDKRSEQEVIKSYALIINDPSIPVSFDVFLPIAILGLTPEYFSWHYFARREYPNLPFGCVYEVPVKILPSIESFHGPILSGTKNNEKHCYVQVQDPTTLNQFLSRVKLVKRSTDETILYPGDWVNLILNNYSRKEVAVFRGPWMNYEYLLPIIGSLYLGEYCGLLMQEKLCAGAWSKEFSTENAILLFGHCVNGFVHHASLARKVTSDEPLVLTEELTRGIKLVRDMWQRTGAQAVQEDSQTILSKLAGENKEGPIRAVVEIFIEDGEKFARDAMDLERLDPRSKKSKKIKSQIDGRLNAMMQNGYLILNWLYKQYFQNKSLDLLEEGVSRLDFVVSEVINNLEKARIRCFNANIINGKTICFPICFMYRLEAYKYILQRLGEEKMKPIFGELFLPKDKQSEALFKTLMDDFPELSLTVHRLNSGMVQIENILTK